MPGKGKAKGKKGKSKIKLKKSANNASSSAGGFFGFANYIDTTLPTPRERLIDLLTSNAVGERELFGMKVSTRSLKKLTPQEIGDLKGVFEAFDFREKGFINAVDVRKAMKCLGFQMNKEQAKRLVYENGIHGNEIVDFSEFLDIVISQQGASRDVYDEILQGFKMFDYDGVGKISLDNLRKACAEAGVKFNEEELQEMLLEADLNGDGLVDEEEFIKVMLQTNLF